MKTVVITNGVFSDTGEALPDREQLTATYPRCKSCGQIICQVPGCEASGAALARLLDGREPVTYTEAEIEAAKIRSRKGK